MTESVDEKDWVPITDPMFENEADVIGDILEAEDIPAKTASLNRYEGRYSIFGTSLKTAQVLVPKDLLEKARALLDAKEKEAESK